MWDEIAAMGAPRRTPGQAITALSEAIDVIRATWSTEGSRPARASSEKKTGPRRPKTKGETAPGRVPAR